MSKKCIDRVGQVVNVNDWAAITQHNEIFVGKVIKAGNSITIAVDSIHEKAIKNKIATASWAQKREWIDKNYPHKKYSYYSWPSWARDGKFIKITPTEEMLLAYDKS